MNIISKLELKTPMFFHGGFLHIYLPDTDEKGAEFVVNMIREFDVVTLYDGSFEEKIATLSVDKVVWSVMHRHGLMTYGEFGNGISKKDGYEKAMFLIIEFKGHAGIDSLKRPQSLRVNELS